MPEPAGRLAFDEPETSPLDAVVKGFPQYSIGFPQFEEEERPSRHGYTIADYKGWPTDVWFRAGLLPYRWKSFEGLYFWAAAEAYTALTAERLITFYTPADVMAAVPQLTEEEVAAIFERNRDRWLAETSAMSSLSDIAMHEAYQEIIGLGPAALPLIFRDLEHRPAFWFWALASITRANPEHEEGDFESARQAWLRWGRDHGYI